MAKKRFSCSVIDVPRRVFPPPFSGFFSSWADGRRPCSSWARPSSCLPSSCWAEQPSSSWSSLDWAVPGGARHQTASSHRGPSRRPSRRPSPSSRTRSPGWLFFLGTSGDRGSCRCVIHDLDFAVILLPVLFDIRCGLRPSAGVAIVGGRRRGIAVLGSNSTRHRGARRRAQIAMRTTSPRICLHI